MNYSISDSIRQTLKSLNLDLSKEIIKETPDRVAEMYRELVVGYQIDEAEVFKVFDNENYQEMVVISNIQFYSLCEHHLIPFFGKVHIGYLPGAKILGLSKFGRLVDIFSKRLQLQERLTQQLADSIVKHLKPRGVIVFIEAEHLCMSMRGVEKPGTLTSTLVKSGVFADNPTQIDLFFHQIRKLQS